MKYLFLLLVIPLFITSCAKTTQFVKILVVKLILVKQKFMFLDLPIWVFLLKINIFDNKKLIGKLGPNSYLCWEISEGEHIIKCNSENEDYVILNVKSGMVYYL